MARRYVRFAAAGALALVLAAPASASPIVVTFAATSGATAFSGAFVYESSVNGAGAITGPPYGGSITLPTGTFVSSEVRWGVLTSGCFTGGGCVVLGLSEPAGPGLVHFSTLVFGFPSLPSTDMPDTATLATADPLGFLDLVMDEAGFVQEILFTGGVTSLSFSVPEPRALALLIASGLVISVLRRRAA